jgi:hypothetical protein
MKIRSAVLELFRAYRRTDKRSAETRTRAVDWYTLSAFKPNWHLKTVVLNSRTKQNTQLERVFNSVMPPAVQCLIQVKMLPVTETFQRAIVLLGSVHRLNYKIIKLPFGNWILLPVWANHTQTSDKHNQRPNTQFPVLLSHFYLKEEAELKLVKRCSVIIL